MLLFSKDSHVILYDTESRLRWMAAHESCPVGAHEVELTYNSSYFHTYTYKHMQHILNEYFSTPEGV